MWQCFAFISGLTVIEHPGKQLIQEQFSGLEILKLNTSHLTANIVILGRILVFWTRVEHERKATYVPCAKRELHHKNKYKIKELYTQQKRHHHHQNESSR